MESGSFFRAYNRPVRPSGLLAKRQLQGFLWQFGGSNCCSGACYVELASVGRLRIVVRVPKGTPLDLDMIRGKD